MKIPHLGTVVVCTAVLASLAACVTPTGIKEASTGHAQNLAELQQAVRDYRGKVGSHFKTMLATYREAFVAQNAAGTIDQIANANAEAVATANAPAEADPGTTEANVGATEAAFAGRLEALSGELSENIGALGGEMGIWGERFDLILKEFAPDPNADEQDAFQMPALRAYCNVTLQLQLGDEELTYTVPAITSQRIAHRIDLRLQVLEAQIEAMRAYHGKVDEYLSIDASIDLAKIGEAVAAGSRFDFAELMQDVTGGEQ